MTNINIIIVHCRSLIVLPNWGISRQDYQFISSIHFPTNLIISNRTAHELLSRSHQRPVKL